MRNMIKQTPLKPVTVKYLVSRGLDARFIADGLEKFKARCDDTEAAKLFVLKYLNNFPKLYRECPGLGILLMGVPGSGKSMLIHAMMAELFMRHNQEPLAVHMDDILLANGKKWSEDGVNWRHLQAVALLLVEDFPNSTNNSRDPFKVFEPLLRLRFSQGKPTIILTSLEPKQLRAAMPPELDSLLVEACLFEKSLLKVKNFRAEKGKEVRKLFNSLSVGDDW